MTDADYAALTIWGESRGEPVEGRIAVACVLRNRLDSKRWGYSLSGVCLAPGQFSCWSRAGGATNYQKVLVLEELVNAGNPIADRVFAECRWIVEGLLSGALIDRVRQATHYHVATMPAPPTWAKGLTPVCKVGSHAFYSGVK